MPYSLDAKKPRVKAKPVFKLRKGGDAQSMINLNEAIIDVEESHVGSLPVVVKLLHLNMGPRIFTG
jgi:hypothetical protein